MEYFDIDSQQKDELIDVEKIASNKECIVGSEDAGVSIMRTNEIAKRTTLEARNSCQPNGYMSSCKRPMGHQEQTVLQGQIALKETLVSVTVASKGALKIQKPNGQKQKNRKKNKVKFQLVRRERWTVETGESLNFIENSFTRNESQVFKRARFCKERRQLKGGIHIIRVKGKTLMV